MVLLSLVPPDLQACASNRGECKLIEGASQQPLIPHPKLGAKRRHAFAVRPREEPAPGQRVAAGLPATSYEGRDIANCA